MTQPGLPGSHPPLDAGRVPPRKEYHSPPIVVAQEQATGALGPARPAGLHHLHQAYSDPHVNHGQVQVCSGCVLPSACLCISKNSANVPKLWKMNGILSNSKDSVYHQKGIGLAQQYHASCTCGRFRQQGMQSFCHIACSHSRLGQRGVRCVCPVWEYDLPSLLVAKASIF